jgi:RND family efflux transporter MFP subunit
MKKLPFLFLAGLLGTALVLSACGSGGPQAAETESQVVATPTAEPRTPIEVATVETGDINLVYDYTGNLKAKDEVNITPGVAGRIETVLIEVGDEVETGDVIATIERDAYITQVRQAQASLTSAKLNLAKMELGSRPEQVAVAEAAVGLARAALNDVATINDNERTTAAAELARTQAALTVAQAEYDKIAWAGDVGTTIQAQALERATIAYQDALAKYQLDTNPSDSQLAPLMSQLAQAELALILAKQPFREIDFDIARVGIEQGEAALELANLQLDETSIKAPFDGVVAELYVTEGASASPQASIGLLVSRENEVEIEVEENRIGQIFEGQHASLQTSAYPGAEFPAVVSNVAPTADRETRTFTVKVTPIDESNQLRAGMFANVSILADEKTNALLVPRAAVNLVGDQATVYVVNGDTVEQREVTVGLSNRDQVEILSGLEAGETVVTAGQPNLTDGAKVEAVNRL